jgi:hypothetical protein
VVGLLEAELFKNVQFSVPLPRSLVSNYWEAVGMENKQERPQFHEERKAQKLLKRIEKQAREADAKRTLDDYGKKVGR